MHYFSVLGILVHIKCITSNSTPNSYSKGVPMVKIDKDSHRPFYEQLVIGIKEDILQGILEPGDQIPSVREMAKILLMNPNTISKAYKVLESEQVLVTVKGKGTFVKQVESRPRDLRRIEELQQQFNELEVQFIDIDNPA